MRVRLAEFLANLRPAFGLGADLDQAPTTATDRRLLDRLGQARDLVEASIAAGEP